MQISYNFSEISNQKNSIDNLERKNRKRERKKQEVKENQVKSTEFPLDTIDSRLVISIFVLSEIL